MAAIAKITVNEMAIRVTSEAIQVHGGYGFTDEFPVSRFYRGARYGTLGGGTTETLKDLVGKKHHERLPARRLPRHGTRSDRASGVRSLLFVPGDDERKIAKALDSAPTR